MSGSSQRDLGVRSFDSWAVVYRSSDDAQWLAHSVQYNLMAWADTPAEARAALERVMEEALLDDLNSGFDSERRPAAPPEVQELLERLFRTGRSVDMSAPDVAEREQVKTFAFQ